MAAKNYTEILALVNAGNQMGLSNTIKRDYGIPLDFTSVQPSYNDAVIYAAENTKAYVGQPLSVGGKLYIINDVAAETKHVVGEKEYDNYLVEVGSATEGDGVTIDLEEGVLTLHGFESALTGYLPRKAEDGSLEWVPISAVVQGDGNKVTTLTSEDGSVTIVKKTDTDESLVYDLSVEHPDAPEYAIAADERAEGATSTTYHLTKDGENVDVAIVVPDAYNDTALANRVKAIEDDYLTEADKYDDTALAARVKALEDEERYDETPLANRVGALETAVGNTESGLVKDLADEVTRAKAAEKELSDAIAAIDFVDEGELATALNPYAKTEDVNASLALKADKSALEELASTVDAFLTGDGTEAALDSLKELIAYIESHDDTDIAGILEAIQAIENKLVGVDTTVTDYVTAAIDALKIGDYAKAADLTELAGRVAVLEAKPFDTYATKTELSEHATAAENAYAKKTDLQTHEQTAEATYAKKTDVVDNTTFESFKTTNSQAIADAAAGAVAEVEGKGYAVATEVADTYATKQSVTDLGNTINATLNDYAKTADVNAELAKKIETATISHSTDEKAEGVTKNGTQLDIVVDAFTKAETRQYVADTIKTMTGGESAADVKLLLENHIAAYEEKVGQIDAKDLAQDTSIGEAKAQADKGVNDAKAAKDVADAAATQAEVNKTDIAGHLTRIQALETTKGTHETRLSTAEGQITALVSADEQINTTLGTIAGQITALQGKDTELAALLAEHATEIGKKANAADVYTKGEVDSKVQEAIDAIPEVNLDPYAKTEDVAKTYATIAALESIYKAGEGEAAATGVLAEEIARATAAEKKIADDLALLIENPTEALDSVKELIDHVTTHGTDIAGIVTRLDGHDESIAGILTRVDALEAKPDYVLPAATKDTLGGVKLSDEVGTNDDGQLEVKTLSTDKLVQGTLELVLNGGTATGAASAN